MSTLIFPDAIIVSRALTCSSVVCFPLVEPQPVIHLEIWVDSHLVRMMVQIYDHQKDQLKELHFVF